jgi:hypothetical protein
MKITREQLGQLTVEQLCAVIDRAAEERIAKSQTAHGFHVIALLLTFGFWVFFWAICAWSNSSERTKARIAAGQLKTDLLLGIVDSNKLFRFITRGHTSWG